MRTGQVFETAECSNCGGLIRHTYWGAAGTEWTHTSTSRAQCHKPPRAEPVSGSVTPVSGNPG